MIDELVRDALESQVGPPAAPGVWPRIDRAGSIARQRRRRARVVSVAAVSLVVLVAAAVAWGGLRSSRSGTRITVTTSPPPVAGEPPIAAGTAPLPTVDEWKHSSSEKLMSVALTTARVVNGGRALVVYGPGGGVCDQPLAYRLRTSTNTVSIELLRIDTGAMRCLYGGPLSYLVELPEPLGGRKVVDAGTGWAVVMLNDSHLLVPHELPADWSAQTEALYGKGTWSRCYGPGSCYATATAVTTAQGTNVDDVLYSPLGHGGEVGLPQQTYLPQLELAKLPFAYGPNSERNGQAIPAADKLSVDVDGHDAVLLLSWASEVVVWKDGPTWHSVATSRERARDRRYSNRPQHRRAAPHRPQHGARRLTGRPRSRPTMPAMRTRLTDILEIEHPVMLAGMGGVSYHRVVAAVSEAGGFGCLGASTMAHERMIEEIALVNGLTDKPFGVDLLTAAPGDMSKKVQDIIDGGARVFVAGLGVPRDVIEQCHKANVLVINMCGKVRHATAAVAAGCDIVVAQGTEAGGHTGQVATMALVPQVVDAVGDQVPVVAAGGLFDGRGLAAALALGADGVWMGTRFIATPEAQAVPGYKEALLAIGEDGTVVTRAYTGKTCRVVRNEYTQYWDEHPDELQGFPLQVLKSMEDGANHLGDDESTTGIDPHREFFPSGQGAGAIHELVPAGDLVHQIVAEAESALSHANALT